MYVRKVNTYTDVVFMNICVIHITLLLLLHFHPGNYVLRRSINIVHSMIYDYLSCLNLEKVVLKNRLCNS